MAEEASSSAAAALRPYRGVSAIDRREARRARLIDAGLELFGTFEHSQGRSSSETSNRQFNQYAVDGVYRFGHHENLFVGLRYNGVTAELKGIGAPVTINRVAAAAGWFLTKNILLKGEYVTQNYKDFPGTDYRNGGKFDGYVVAATIGF